MTYIYISVRANRRNQRSMKWCSAIKLIGYFSYNYSTLLRPCGEGMREATFVIKRQELSSDICYYLLESDICYQIYVCYQ